MARRPTVTTLRTIVRRALEEDRAWQDITTRAVVPRGRPVVGIITAQRAGTLSGLVPAIAVARGMGIRATALATDGAPIARGSAVLRLEGEARRVLSAERTVLNFLMHLSGIATLTRRTVTEARRAAPRFRVLGTRKTTPGLRSFEKEAVRHGGGGPHRGDLRAAILVKNNHIAVVGLDAALEALSSAERRRAEVEVRSIEEARRALSHGIRKLLLDNFSAPSAKRTVRAIRQLPRGRGAFLELSGGIRPTQIRSFARTGADAASLGSLTHSAPALPFHLVVRRRPVHRRHAA